MFVATRDKILPTAMIGSFPRPAWFNENLNGRPFKVAMSDSKYREQYHDAVRCYLSEQEQAGLDILVDGDSRNDLEVGGRSWFFYTIERLSGISGFRDSSHFLDYGDMRPGHILYEVQESWHPPTVEGQIDGGELHFVDIWKTAQKMTRNPVKFGNICAICLPMMLWNEHYPSDKEMIMDIAAVLNEEYKELAKAGCKVIQIEEPVHHFNCQMEPPASDSDLKFYNEAFNRQVKDVETEIWAHTCWGNPNQQSFYWERPSYDRALDYFLDMKCDVIDLECASNQARDAALFKNVDLKKYGKKIGIGVVDHTRTTVESPEMVADTIRRALEFIPEDRLVITADCGFGREGLSRRIAYYKCVSLVLGTNIVRSELGLEEKYVAASDDLYSFS